MKNPYLLSIFTVFQSIESKLGFYIGSLNINKGLIIYFVICFKYRKFTVKKLNFNETSIDFYLLAINKERAISKRTSKSGTAIDLYMSTIGGGKFQRERCLSIIVVF